MPSRSLQVAGVTHLQLQQSRGPKDVFVFDPHRLAMTCWAWMFQKHGSALLLTLDRHFDLVPPQSRVDEKLGSQSLRQIDEFVRWDLNERNVDHILASMEAGFLSDVVAVARTRPQGCFEGDIYQDTRGRTHHIVRAPTVDALSFEFGTPRASEKAQQTLELVEKASAIFLDVDLDCFTSPSDADPTTVIPWPKEVIAEHLMPNGSELFWEKVLAKTMCLTMAREPAHCGGLIATGRLFETVAEVLFEKLLQADLP